jgi:hypothetical protein
MLFVALLKARPATMDARVARRLEWELPDGAVEPVAEYWLQTPDPAGVVVFEADHITQMWTAFAGWDDFFDISIYPAIAAEEALEILKQ